MSNDEEKLKLSDLIDINLVQKLQDTFAQAMGISSLTIDADGAITKPSNNSEFCMKFLRANQVSSARCINDDVNNAKLASEKGEPIIYTCHAGLTNFVVPIMVKGRNIASIFGGQVFTEKPDERHLKNLAKSLRIPNESEYIKALRKIKIHSREHIKFASEYLFIVANVISDIANKNLELIKKNKKDKFYNDIIEAIRSSLDINETLSFICEETAKFFDVQRATISEAPKDKKGGAPVIRMEFKTVFDAEGVEKLVNRSEISEYYAEILETGSILVINNVSESNTPDFFKESYIAIGVKSLLAIPIQKYNDKWGILILSEYNNYRVWSDEEIELAKSIASQIYIAIKHAELYEDEKNISAKEVALRKTIEVIRNTLDVEQIKENFLEIACSYFNADRCIFDEYDRETSKFLPFRIEIVKEDGIQSLLNVSVEDDFPEFADKLKNKKRNIIIKDLQKTLSRKNLPNYKAIQTLFQSDAKSDYGLIVQYQDEIMGILILHYVKNKKVFSSEELAFLKILRDQAGIALYQADLYQKSQNQAKREILLREITEKIRSSLDVEEVLYFICEETAKLFNVQRSAITTFPTLNNYEVFIVRKEYKEREDIEGFGFREDARKAASYWGSVLLNCGAVLAVDNIEESDAPDYFKNIYCSMGVKALIGTSIRKGEDAWGTLVLAEYNTYRHWSEDDKILLRTIANQVYIAVNQAELFETARKKAQNEKALRELMLTSVQAFDKKTMLKELVTSTGELFKADRCFFVEVDNETDTNLPIQDYAEYLSSEDIVSHITRSPSKEETNDFILRTKEKMYEFSVDVSNSPIPEVTKKMLMEDLGVKSYFIAPVFYGDVCHGAFVLHYVHNYKQFSQDEIDMVLAIASQSAVILHQAELFEVIKIQAEREKISKNIIEILRSTLDKSIIKRLFVKSIGQFLNADRVIFSEFNQETQTYNPVNVDSEYLSEPDVKSFVGFDWSAPQAYEYIQPILEKREFHIYNWHEYIQGSYKGQDFIDLFEKMDIKSNYSFPVMYQQQIMGFFSISFVKRVRRLTDEDINRIRSICSQAGIALYHARLYQDAQKSVQAHETFVNKLSTELNEPLNLIVEFSSMKSTHEIECIEEVEHLKTINDSAKKLLYFMEDMTKSKKKLNLE